MVFVLYEKLARLLVLALLSDILIVFLLIWMIKN